MINVPSPPLSPSPTSVKSSSSSLLYSNKQMVIDDSTKVSPNVHKVVKIDSLSRLATPPYSPPESGLNNNYNNLNYNNDISQPPESKRFSSLISRPPIFYQERSNNTTTTIPQLYSNTTTITTTTPGNNNNNNNNNSNSNNNNNSAKVLLQPIRNEPPARRQRRAKSQQKREELRKRQLELERIQQQKELEELSQQIEFQAQVQRKIQQSIYESYKKYSEKVVVAHHQSSVVAKKDEKMKPQHSEEDNNSIISSNPVKNDDDDNNSDTNSDSTVSEDTVATTTTLDSNTTSVSPLNNNKQQQQQQQETKRSKSPELVSIITKESKENVTSQNKRKAQRNPLLSNPLYTNNNFSEDRPVSPVIKKQLDKLKKILLDSQKRRRKSQLLNSYSNNSSNNTGFLILNNSRLAANNQTTTITSSSSLQLPKRNSLNNSFNNQNKNQSLPIKITPRSSSLNVGGLSGLSSRTGFNFNLHLGNNNNKISQLNHELKTSIKDSTQQQPDETTSILNFWNEFESLRYSKYGNLNTAGNTRSITVRPSVAAEKTKLVVFIDASLPKTRRTVSHVNANDEYERLMKLQGILESVRDLILRNHFGGKTSWKNVVVCVVIEAKDEYFPDPNLELIKRYKKYHPEEQQEQEEQHKEQKEKESEEEKNEDETFQSKSINNINNSFRNPETVISTVSNWTNKLLNGNSSSFLKRNNNNDNTIIMPLQQQPSQQITPPPHNDHQNEGVKDLFNDSISRITSKIRPFVNSSSTSSSITNKSSSSIPNNNNNKNHLNINTFMERLGCYQPDIFPPIKPNRLHGYLHIFEYTTTMQVLKITPPSSCSSLQSSSSSSSSESSSSPPLLTPLSLSPSTLLSSYKRLDTQSTTQTNTNTNNNNTTTNNNNNTNNNNGEIIASNILNVPPIQLMYCIKEKNIVVNNRRRATFNWVCQSIGKVLKPELTIVADLNKSFDKVLLELKSIKEEKENEEKENKEKEENEKEKEECDGNKKTKKRYSFDHYQSSLSSSSSFQQHFSNFSTAANTTNSIIPKDTIYQLITSKNKESTIYL